MRRAPSPSDALRGGRRSPARLILPVLLSPIPSAHIYGRCFQKFSLPISPPPSNSGRCGDGSCLRCVELRGRANRICCGRRSSGSSPRDQSLEVELKSPYVAPPPHPSQVVAQPTCPSQGTAPPTWPPQGINGGQFTSPTSANNALQLCLQFVHR
jgi:hypothetical protein